MWNVVWLKCDLRVHDHEPLARAGARGPVLPIHVIEPALWQQPDASGRHWAFIRESLLALRADLHRHGLPLVVRRGEIVDVLDRLNRKVGIKTLSAHQETGNGWSFALDLRGQAWCRTHGMLEQAAAVLDKHGSRKRPAARRPVIPPQGDLLGAP